jgi:sugar phosphate isomerase/epimerase
MAEFHNERSSDMDTDTRLAFSRQGAPTSPQTPNQIAEMGRLLNSGMKNVEVGTLQQEMFETIPIQHFKEMKRVAKLTGSKISVHGPLVDPAGFTQQGWTEESREENERYIKAVMDRSHELDPDGNIPVNMHTTLGVPGTITAVDEKGKPMRWKAEEVERMRDKGFTFKRGEEVKQLMHVVDKEKGQIIPLKREVLEYLDEQRTWTPEERLEMLNRTSWDQDQLQLMSYNKAKQELEHMNNRITGDPKWLELNTEVREAALQGEGVPKEAQLELEKMHSRIQLNNQQIAEYDQHLYSGINSLHNKYVKYRGEPQNEREKMEYGRAEKQLKKTRKEYHNFDEKWHKQVREIQHQFRDEQMEGPEYNHKINQLQLQRSEFHDQILSDLSTLPAPHFYVSAEDFAKDKSVETLSNVAAHSYKKYGEKSPILAMENFMPTTVLSRADSMRDLIKKTRKKFVEKITKSKGLSESEAQAAADRIIGATWDVGHLHQLRKQGFSDKELVKETEKIAPFVKHVHLTDNFGHADSHLPLGMGDVPIKAHLKELEKTADKDRRNIIEAGAYPQHFKQSPMPQSLEYLESPVYTYDAGPSWAEARDMYASYLVGYGDILPEKHFDTFFGAGFSRLPKELGGQGQANKSQFSGTPNQ